jgi:hypothetical protein
MEEAGDVLTDREKTLAHIDDRALQLVERCGAPVTHQRFPIKTPFFYLPDKTAKCGSFATAQDSAPAINTRSRVVWPRTRIAVSRPCVARSIT